MTEPIGVSLKFVDEVLDQCRLSTAWVSMNPKKGAGVIFNPCAVGLMLEEPVVIFLDSRGR
jgi:hypothetical protein